MGQKIVVIGGVSAGTKAASRARRRDPQADIVVLEKGVALSYAGCGTPYFIAGTIPDYKELMATPVGVVRDGAFFRNVKAVSVLNRTLAETIDRKAKVVRTVHIESGERREVPYDRLVIATGSQPIRPPIPGMELSGVCVLGNLDDARAIRAEIESGVRTIAIIGGGLIGMEVAESLTEGGSAVTVIEQRDHVLPNLLDPEMALLAEKHLRQKKVTLLTATSVLRFAGDDRGRVARVVTDRGEVPADLVVVAAGVRPDVSLAREAGLAIGPHGGIAVDDALRTSDPDIFAGGDCVENRHLLTGSPVYAPLGSTANKHGRVIGDNLTGGATRYPGVLGTVILKIFDFNVGCTGLSERAARQAGFDVETALVAGPDRAHYYPGSKTLFLKGVADRATGRLLGVQAIGPGDASKRIDTAAVAIAHGIPLHEIAMADLSYAPPYSNALDNLVHLATTLENKIAGLASAYTPFEVRAKIDRGDEFIMLDVRTPDEHREARIDDPRLRFIPLGKLRERAAELPRDREIVAYCKTSLRAYEAQRILEGSGLGGVRFLDGGIAYWPFELAKE